MISPFKMNSPEYNEYLGQAEWETIYRLAHDFDQSRSNCVLTFQKNVNVHRQLPRYWVKSAGWKHISSICIPCYFEIYTSLWSTRIRKLWSYHNLDGATCIESTKLKRAFTINFKVPLTLISFTWSWLAKYVFTTMSLPMLFNKNWYALEAVQRQTAIQQIFHPQIWH